MAAKKTDHEFTTIVLDDSVPTDLEAINAKIVTLAKDFSRYEQMLNDFYQTTQDKLIKARDAYELKNDPAAFLARLQEQHQKEIDAMRAELEAAILGGIQEDLDKLMQKTPKTKRLAPVKRIRRPRYRFRRPTVL